MKYTFSILFLLALLATGCKSNQYADLGDGLYAEMQTSEGEIILRLEYEKTPVTVANFVTLAEGTSPFVSEEFKGKPYYDGVSFHRVMKDFMIQGGDPTGTGRGTPGYRFSNEIVDSLVHDRKGILSMANSGGTKTNGSQFFITHAPTPWLDGIHTVFGEVVKGIEVVDSIAAVTVEPGNNKPVDSVLMEKVEIVRKGKDARDFDAVAVMENYFAQEEAAEAAQREKLENAAAEFASQKAEATSLPSGLSYKVVNEGEGPKPAIGDMVLVNYSGWLEDGTLIDSSEESVAREFGMLDQLVQMHRGALTPYPMPYSPDTQLIAGFKEALLLMEVGDKWRVFIPSHLAYGEQGNGPVPPGASMVFDLEILGIQGGE
ncbi:peptidylprolyl isomerase [Robiginitalea sp. SC105]|uniref:peptidylprolyl isomerase n=1 Tax=Robiginitalea sp. SC105 TaxID=2762332 RepID=UPI001639BE8A|nr:peptidylprolyl isomerase [Robiginitalea sp. SC105]MBC2839223.1 peptidylprolyl isomerase [Robiginitalea sp. SC105]